MSKANKEEKGGDAYRNCLKEKLEGKHRENYKGGLL